MAVSPQQLRKAARVRQEEDYILDAWSERRVAWRDWRDRVDRLDAFIRGDWVVEFPDGRTVGDKPKIENRVLTGIEDTARLAGSFLPTLRVEAPNEQGVEKAQRREQVIAYYWQLSHLAVKLPRLYADLISTGMAMIKVWPDFSTPIEKRFPIFSRIDPRGVLLPPNQEDGVEPDDVIVVRKVKARQLARMFPEQTMMLRERSKDPIADTTEVDVIDYYSEDQISSVAYHGEGHIMLVDVENRIGRLPIVPVLRPSADGQLRGQFDPVLPPLAAENRLATYLLDYADQMVYAPILKQGNVGDIDFGPGAIIDAGDGNVTRVPPAQAGPEVFRMMADLERSSRRAGFMPEARSGDISQSIGSAAFVESLMGSLTTNIRTLQLVMEKGLERANEVAQAVDRSYCDASKSVVGFAQGGQFRMSYTPTNLIKDDEFGNIVTYGAGTGLDAFNREVRLLRRVDTGMVSKRWARNQLEGVENVLKVENEILDEKLMEAVVTGIQARASEGDLGPATVLQQARQNNVNPLEVLPQMLAAAQQAPEGPSGVQPTALPGEATAGQQIAAAQTGVPGGGTQGLPDLADLGLA